MKSLAIAAAVLLAAGCAADEPEPEPSPTFAEYVDGWAAAPEQCAPFADGVLSPTGLHQAYLQRYYPDGDGPAYAVWLNEIIPLTCFPTDSIR